MANIPRSVSRTTVDIVYDACFTGAVGGSLVALFFLVVDTLNGQPFFTPALLGTALFEGGPVESIVDPGLEMMAYYTVVHCTVFLAVGAALAFLVYEVELHTRHPILVLLLLFVILEAGFAVAASIFMPGVISKLGPIQVGAANLLGAGGMAFFVLSHYHRVLGRSPEEAHV